MASLQEAIKVDTSRYRQVERPSMPIYPEQNRSLEPVINSMLRCPLPPMQVSPDNLRQFYLNGQVPQIRLLTPSTNTVRASSGGSVITNNRVTQIVSGGSSSSSLAVKSVSVTTPSLNSGDNFQTAAMVAKAYQLLSVSASGPCEVRLYGSVSEQVTDSARGLDVPVAAGVGQNIVSDVALDSVPYVWYYQNRVGANADTPQSNLLYITVINLDEVSDVISVVLQYVGMVN